MVAQEKQRLPAVQTGIDTADKMSYFEGFPYNGTTGDTVVRLT